MILQAIEGEKVVIAIRELYKSNDGDEATQQILIALGSDILDVSTDRFMELMQEIPTITYDGNRTASYRYNCVNPGNEDELKYIMDNMTPITFEEFKEHVNTDDLSDLTESLGYTPDFPIEKDWHVRYYECELENKQKTAYILVHSAIEHIFYE